MVVDVISDDACPCTTSGAGGVAIVPNLDPKTGILVRSKAGIVTGNIINKYNESGVIVYELDDFTLVRPVITFGVNSPIKEVGDTQASVLFSGTWGTGSNGLTSKVLSPAEGGVEASTPFSFTKTNVKLTAPGLGQSHTFTVTDNQGYQSILTAGVIFKHAFYQGFNGLATLDQTAIKALANKTLVDSILSNYGGAHNYVVPGAAQLYIYWAGPIGTPAPQGAILNGLPLALVDPGNVTVTNIYDNTLLIGYWVRRTAVRFDPGTYNITIS